MKAYALAAIIAATCGPVWAQSDLDLSQYSTTELEAMMHRIAAEKSNRRIAEIDAAMATLEAEKAALLGGKAKSIAPPKDRVKLPVRANVILPKDEPLLQVAATNETVEQPTQAPPAYEKTETPDKLPQQSEAKNTRQERISGESETDILAGFGFGGGIGITHNLSGTRIADWNLERLPDNALYLQVTESEEQSIRFVAESHFLFKNVGAPEFDENGEKIEGHPLGWIADFATCGLFSLTFAKDSSYRRGCGPFVVGFASDNSLIEEFGFGHMVSFGKPGTNGEGPEGAFNIGYGLMFDPDSRTLDTRLLEPDSYIVRPEFSDLVEAGDLDVVTEEETMGFFLLFSANL